MFLNDKFILSLYLFIYNFIIASTDETLFSSLYKVEYELYFCCYFYIQNLSHHQHISSHTHTHFKSMHIINTVEKYAIDFNYNQRNFTKLTGRELELKK